ncbi:MAG TPA: cysteine desulfurase family protein [Verrucomicrobiae bacterium]|nr:cysteine desulfurase family protein [Verrucomicrobiae bacterium]
MGVYLDHLSGSPPHPAVLEEMAPFLDVECGSPSAVHSMGVRARRAIETAKGRVAALVCARHPDEIIFTSGGTEAANLAVKGAALAGGRTGGHIVATTAEHPAVAESLRWLEGRGYRVTRVGLDALGRADPAAVGEAMREDTFLVVTHLVQHDIGTVQRVAEIGALARRAGAVFCCDAAWGAGWVPVDVGAMCCDLMSLAPARFGGPRGAGALYRRRGVALEPLLHGGVQEGGLRAGGENVAGLIGAGRAALEAERDFVERVTRARALQERFVRGMASAVPSWALNGPRPGEERAPNSLSLSIACVEAEALALACDLKGVIFGASTSCVSRSMRLSAVLRAIGQPDALAAGHLLVGLGRDSTEADVDSALSVLPRVVGRLREMSPSWGELLAGGGDPVVVDWLMEHGA